MTELRNELANEINQAAEYVNSFWPLSTFIASNALKGFEKMPFEHSMRLAPKVFGGNGFLELKEYRRMYETGRIRPANLKEAFAKYKQLPEYHGPDDLIVSIQTLGELVDIRFNSGIVESLNSEMMKWCASFLDCNHSQWGRTRQSTLLSHWRELVIHDLAFSNKAGKTWKELLKTLPSEPLEIIENCFKELELQSPEIRTAYLAKQLVLLPGWASYLKYLQAEKGSTILLDYFAIRLLSEHLLSKAVTDLKPILQGTWYKRAAAESSEKIAEDFAPVWQEAYELGYRDDLLASLSKAQSESKQQAAPSCQLVFCIDVRSEPMRREIEASGPYDTYGFAGFFGVPMCFRELGSSSYADLCPVLLKPSKKVEETADDTTAKNTLSWQAMMVSAVQLRKRLKCDLAGSFGLVEMTGLLSAPLMALKTFFPSIKRKLSKSIENYFCPAHNTQLDLKDFSLQEKTEFAGAVLNAIGLGGVYSKIVVVCGHGSSSSNNPYASALDCGACGGNAGRYSARLLADILNDPDVRAGLAKAGKPVPEDTLFVAGEHNTTTDRLEIFEGVAPVSPVHRQILSGLKIDLSHAGQRLRNKRAATLPQSVFDKFNDVETRASDWAQVAPEWGLAGNAAFIAAPRSLTAEVDLHGRCFLHSYEYDKDSDWKVLELIMTAPLVVAQWINMQYYLSSVDNKAFGSGSKVLHNVVGDFGVMQGAQSDLRIGLPLQSVASTEGKLFHEPMRLLALIRAPLSAIDSILGKHKNLASLVRNRWIRLMALDPYTGQFFQCNDIASWTKVDVNSTDAPVPALNEEWNVLV